MSEVELALLLVMMVLASVTTFRASRRWYVPLALAWTVAFVLLGSLSGLTRAEMGWTNWLHGVVWGAAAIGIVSVGMGLGVAIPRLHPLFADERIVGSSGAEVAQKSLIEIPLGTVLLEEIVFRSVLLGMLTHLYGTVVGVLGSAFVFGLWHILPALEMHGAHSMTDRLGSGWRAKLGTVVVTILATGGAGVLFAMMVVWSGSILAPMGLHWAMNGPGSIAAWLVGKRQTRAKRGGKPNGTERS